MISISTASSAPVPPWAPARRTRGAPTHGYSRLGALSRRAARRQVVWQADRHDVVAFHRARRLSDAAYRISASSWNRSIAALDKLYRWAVEEEVITTRPSATCRAAPGAGTRTMVAVATNRARERAARRHDTRYIDLGRYLLFRDVGLRGRLPDGSEDPAWRGRNASGMRCSPSFSSRPVCD